MLYESALRFVALAKRKLIEQDIAAKGQYISKTLAIVTELDCALDHDIGGDISTELSRLYQYMISCLTRANVHNDSTGLDEVESLLRQLQEAFTIAVKSEAESLPIQSNSPQTTTTKGVNIAV
jgi:flagellar protein FliS